MGPPRKEGEEPNERFKDIAASTQVAYEEVFFHILNSLQKQTGFKSIALSGGCIQNSLANGKIYDKTPFEEVYIPPATYDAGGAIGAAFYLFHQIMDKARSFVMDSAYWGPSYTNDKIEEALNKNNIAYKKLNDDELLKKVARDIAGGKIVGWFQGRTEIGPRALGNRSILADPRNKEMKDILNLRIKRREDFRPFAPSILEEDLEEWFETDKPVPFMEKVYKVKKDKRDSLPAVCHVDGTGRVQTVNSKSNNEYYDLIKKFKEITGIPIVLNTSFNENEPIVNTPEDAVECFLRTKMDVLVLEDYYIARQ